MCCWQIKINSWGWGLKSKDAHYWFKLSPFSCCDSNLIFQPLPSVSLVGSPSIDFQWIAGYGDLGKLCLLRKRLSGPTRGALSVVGKVWVQIWQSLKEPCSKGQQLSVGCGEVTANGRGRLEEAGPMDSAGVKSGLPNLVNIFLLVARS